MKKIITLFGLAFFALGAVSVSSAATFDFISYADGDADNDGHHEWGYDKNSGFSVTESGISLTATATALYSGQQIWQDAHVYLDRGNAGMGVCKVLNGSNQCNPSNDDNVTPNEALKLAFDQIVSLDSITFKNGGHGTTFAQDAKFDLNVDGGGWTTYSLVNLFTNPYLPLSGYIFEVRNLNTATSNGYQFYIDAMNVSAVPIPAAIWLFGSALLGFTAVRRNAKSAAKMTA